MAIGLGALQLNTLIDGLIASWPTLVGPTIPFLDVAYPLTEGSMASLTFAQRLYEFPLGVFGIAIATSINSVEFSPCSKGTRAYIHFNPIPFNSNSIQHIWVVVFVSSSLSIDLL